MVVLTYDIAESSTESPVAEASAATPATLPPRAANLTGALQLQQQQAPGGPAPGPPLVLGLEAVVDTTRLVQWQCSSSSDQFYTETQINGTWQVAAAAAAGAGATTTATTPVSVAGTLRLVSPGWPGPGFTGSYQWSGNLTVSPDPWSLLVTNSTPAPTRHRCQLLSAAGVSVGVSGPVVVREVTLVSVPDLLQDTLRGDNLLLLDVDSSVVVLGADVMPAAALLEAPSWKQTGVTSAEPAPVPLLGYTGPAIAGIVVGSVAAGVGITLLGVFGFRRLRRDAQQPLGLQEP
jgi:hypothetical protein